ncbi:hypothetical protein LO749_20870 [Paracoccus denitrificans]|uniref:hypothetical protein n=1 Tax=Paracoccus denitrificans TaxID=266 RepID=UPI001E629216|nr:hypothetical protein [Paracoccus denitrificans]UFS66948.1 hypothetical protein LO749_20870 [Paracoccus denitrificans]
MARLNVATKTDAQTRAARKAENEALKEAGANIVEEKGASYRVTETFGVTVKTRID